MSESPVQQVDESGVGAFLRAQREARGITLETAAKVTRISKSYLEAIEQEEFSRLPNIAYCKGFIRVYAVYLGLSGNDLVARYDRSVQPPTILPGPAKGLQQGGGNGTVRTGRNRWLLPIVLLVAILLLSLLIDTDQRPPLQRTVAPSQPVHPVQPAITSAQNAAVTAPVPDSTQPAKPAESPISPASGTVPPDVLIFSLKVNQDSWLNIDIDGRFSQQYDLKAGDLIEWKADSVITLDIGNAGGVEGELNGKTLSPFGPSGKKAHVVLRPEGAAGQ